MEKLSSIDCVSTYLFSIFFKKVLPGRKLWGYPHCLLRGSLTLTLRNSFLDSAKIASVRPIFKKGEITEIGNYTPVCIFNCYSKIYERFLHS